MTRPFAESLNRIERVLVDPSEMVPRYAHDHAAIARTAEMIREWRLVEAERLYRARALKRRNAATKE